MSLKALIATIYSFSNDLLLVSKLLVLESISSLRDIVPQAYEMLYNRFPSVSSSSSLLRNVISFFMDRLCLLLSCHLIFEFNVFFHKSDSRFSCVITENKNA